MSCLTFSPASPPANSSFRQEEAAGISGITHPFHSYSSVDSSRHALAFAPRGTSSQASAFNQSRRTLGTKNETIALFAAGIAGIRELWEVR